MNNEKKMNTAVEYSHCEECGISHEFYSCEECGAPHLEPTRIYCEGCAADIAEKESQ